MVDVLFQPTRGHQCSHLGRWVVGGEEPYRLPLDLAHRRVRAAVGYLVPEPVAEGEAFTSADYDELDRIIADVEEDGGE